MKKKRFATFSPFRTLGGSITKTLQFSYVFIIALMFVPTIYSISFSRLHARQYDRIITNVSRINRINQIVKEEITTEVWNIVAGKETFENGRQYEILDSIKTGMAEIMENTGNAKNRQLLEVASRALGTLKKYVDQLGEQIKANALVSENEQMLEEVRSCAALIYDILQDFIIAEIESAAVTNTSLKASSEKVTWIQLGIASAATMLAVYVLISVSKSIRTPIHRMEELSTRIANGDLQARAELPHVAELDHLTENLNTMAGKIKRLIDENVQEQQNLQKAEMKALQAQITPHFLYNTFDTIIWLAESGETDEVIEITRAFSSFFRISLSKGHEWIPVEQELEHVRNYLTIQKIRYRDILNYEIDFDPGIKTEQVLKLMLQPLVENAIYHGIKNKRGRGKLKVTAKRITENDQELLYFSVEDNGMGILPERLEEVTRELEQEKDPETLSVVYGLYNVHKRLKLYYDESVSLHIQSEYGKGTTVWFAVPVGKSSV
ncbi:MAG: sensor histidine kinase [Treponemataceae bacterium]|nr:sensor histidine kinase [Treponemataceae bacterium]